MRYQFIEAHRQPHRVGRLCQTLGVSRSGYYAWRTRPLSARQQANTSLLSHMQALHTATKARYGAVKLWKALLAVGVVCGRHRVARRHAGTNRVRRLASRPACYQQSAHPTHPGVHGVAVGSLRYGGVDYPLQGTLGWGPRCAAGS